MTFTLWDAVASADRVAEARKRSQARVKGQETRHVIPWEGALANYSLNTRVRMVVSDWYHDEFGNLTRTIRAAE